ncbi:sulfurtransferase [Halobacterium jilantaiense]|uniref:Thiosulfate/3-mercaptopyruvate sulfurtransferase n=1 Tax=Halobacterium jilantaiense TaxID=355548 RepID=A0A1I0PPP3_9EURY|nr:sulfurtransferase [Halobacterium jilantaiense]SEW16211.1 thiosulfate/3-mercaptopyruvate sulfurtransferase [Halobacterium jilantaiense]
MTDDWVVSADWLAAHLDSVRVVDVRDAWEYDGIGHVPDAVSVPFDSFRQEGGPEGMMPTREDWEATLSEAGIESGDTVVAYDDTHGVFAARFLVTALYYGHDDVRLLDGDYSAWIRDHGASSEPPDVTPTDYEAGDPDSGVFVDADDVAAAAEDDDAVVVDTREPWEFEEGHIPGAVNLDWKEVVDDDTRGLKPRDAVEELLASRGVTREKRVVLYCNTARRISHTFAVLGWLGFPDVAFYEGSLTEWEADGRPIESN